MNRKNKWYYWIPFIGLLKFGRDSIRENTVPNDNFYIWFESIHYITGLLIALFGFLYLEKLFIL